MIKMLSPISGERFSLAANEPTDRFSAIEEQRMIDAGFAERIDDRDAPAVDQAPAAPIVEMHVNDIAPITPSGVHQEQAEKPKPVKPAKAAKVA